MADNVLVDNGSGTDYTVASDDDGSAQHQYVKVEFGGDGTFTKVATGTGLPVAGSQTHKAYTASIASALTTELNSLANNSNTSASSAIDNTSNLDMLMDLTLTIATQGVARSVGALVEVYAVDALDGTNYDDVHETTARLLAVFPLDAATTARQLTRVDISIPPGLFKLFARNRTGQTLAASNNLLEYRTHSYKIAG